MQSETCTNWLIQLLFSCNLDFSSCLIRIMLQDTLRSAVYRSLTKPAPANKESGNQSVGYGKKIKYKNSKPTKVNTPPGRRTGPPQSFMEEEEKGNGSGQKSHLQLFQASEGARELTQMIDSLSKAPNLDGRSKYIAKDLLRGARDLQSSLVMLTKLQEESKSVSRSKVKGRHEVVEEEAGMQRTARSNRFALQETRHSVDQSMLKPKRRSKFVEEEIGLEEIKGSRRFGLQEPSHSVDGSARSFLGGHKKTSLKQRPEFMEQDISVGEIMVSKRFGSRKSRFSVDESSRYGVEETKMMSQLKFKQRFEYIKEEIGVEDMTASKRVGKQKPRFSGRNFGEVKRMSGFKLKQRSEYMEQEFDVEETMPSKRFGSQEPRLSVDSVQELRRVIKEGLSRQNLLPQSSDDSQSQSLRSPKTHRPLKFKERGYERKEKLSGPSPAALQPKQAKGSSVIAKLMGLGEVPSATAPTSKREEERKKSLIMPRPAFDIDDRPNARKMQAVETPNPKQKSLHEIIAAMQFKGLLKSSRGEDFRPKSRPYDASQSKMCSRSFDKEDDVPPIVIMKPLYLPLWGREGQKSLLLDKISADEEIHSVNLIGENVDSDHRQLVAKASKIGEMKNTEEASAEVSEKANTLTTVAQKLQRRRASKSGKRTDEGQNLLLEVKKEEKEDMKKKRVLASAANTTYYTAPANPEEQVSASKNKVSEIKPESKNSTIVAKEKKTSTSKSARKSTDTKTDDNHFKDGKRNNSQEGKDSFSKTSSLTVHELPEGAYKEAKPCIQGGKMPEIASEAIRLPHKKTITRIASEVEEDLMCLLLSSRSFINHAKELFLIDAHQPVHHKRKGIGEDVMRNAKLYLDCGKELMVRRSNQHEAFSNRMLRTSSCSLSAFPSLSQLAEEISSVIKVLTSYGKMDDNATSEGNLYLRLERDLRCKEMMSSANWDMGWAGWVCDASRVAGELQELILDSLIAEVAQDMVWL